MTTRRTQSSRRILDQQVSESQLQRDVLQLAGQLGYLAYHVYDSRKSGPDKGFPDLILARDGRVIAVELKTERGRVSRDQARWIWALGALDTIEIFVWRPRDWSSGRIERVLIGSEQRKLGGAA